MILVLVHGMEFLLFHAFIVVNSEKGKKVHVWNEGELKLLKPQVRMRNKELF